MSGLAHPAHPISRRSGPAARTVFTALAALMLAWIGRAGADEGEPSPAGVSKSVSTVTSKADAVDAVGLSCTNSSQYADMPGMLVSFRSGGNSSRAVIVLFQGEWSLGDNMSLEIRLTIDGVVQSGPADVSLAQRPLGGPDESESHGFNFVSDLLAPGLHVARIQWRKLGGGSGCVFSRSLIVLHK